MAERAQSLNFERSQGPAPLVQVPDKNQPRPADSLNDIAPENYRVMNSRASRSFSVMVEKSNALVTRLKWQIRITREEHPLQIVALAAGAACILGIVLRAWRNQHEKRS
jgi:hypothetical protein